MAIETVELLTIPALTPGEFSDITRSLSIQASRYYDLAEKAAEAGNNARAAACRAESERLEALMVKLLK